MRVKLVLGMKSGKIGLVNDEELLKPLIHLVDSRKNSVENKGDWTDIMPFLPAGQETLITMKIDLREVEAYTLELVSDLAVPAKTIRFPN
jgi:hypothetical protein